MRSTGTVATAYKRNSDPDYSGEGRTVANPEINLKSGPAQQVGPDPLRKLKRPGAKGVFFEKPTETFDAEFVVVPEPGYPATPDFPRQEFIGIRFHKTTLEPLLDYLVSQLDSPEFRYVVTPNVDHIVSLTGSEADSDMRSAYDDADLLVCDSRVLSQLAKRSGIELPAVPGSDITARLLEILPAHTSVAVVGGTGPVHEQLRKKYPQFQWRFCEPPMDVIRDVEAQDAICDFLCTAAADVSFIAIGAPQSEIVCHRMKTRQAGRGLALCIGASLEFICGEKKRAPIWMQRASCEWLFRLLSEPHRLAHRYLVKGPKIFFVWHKWRAARAL